MQHVNLAEASERLPSLINAVLNGEEVIIQKDEQTSVKLVVAASSKRRRKPGSAKGLMTIAEDFDAPLEDFKDYM